MESIQMTVARLMYDTYCEAVGGLAYNGDPLPTSEEFFKDETKRKQSEAWIASATAAINYLNQ